MDYVQRSRVKKVARGGGAHTLQSPLARRSQHFFCGRDESESMLALLAKKACPALKYRLMTRHHYINVALGSVPCRAETFKS